MRDQLKYIWTVIFICNGLHIHKTIENPLYVLQHLSGGTGRNFRPLPCVFGKTGEQGVCMFAFSCTRANGTHLGTCINHFFIGSCCKIDEEPEVLPQANTIKDGLIAASSLFLTTLNSIGNSDIPKYYSGPKPSQDKKSSQQPNQITESTTVIPLEITNDLVMTEVSEISSTIKESDDGTQLTTLITSNDWDIIQSPTTEKLEPEPESTLNPFIMFSESSPSVESVTEEFAIESTTEKAIVSVMKATILNDTEISSPKELMSWNITDYKKVCGERLTPMGRIVGGSNSAFGEFPWQISLQYMRNFSYGHICGAVLLSENWAITAAHCVENLSQSALLLRIGEHDLANEDEPHPFVERKVQIVVSHPQFDSWTYEYDLALLKFDESLVAIQRNIMPICVPDNDDNYVDSNAWVTGWGFLNNEGQTPSVLQKVTVPIVDNIMCEKMLRTAGIVETIPNIFMCAGFRKGGRDSCTGDSGGPLVIQRPRDKRWILAGIASWGTGCAKPNKPGVYTRISEFREWVNEILYF